MEKKINGKYIHGVMNVVCVLVSLINKTLILFPLGLVTVFVTLFMNGKRQICRGRYILSAYG